MSADRRFKFTFLAVVLLVLLGFGTWYGFVRQDGGAGEVAQDAIEDSIVQDDLTQDNLPQGELAHDPTGPDATSRHQAMQELSPDDAASSSVVRPGNLEQSPDSEAAMPTGPEIAAVDLTTDQGAPERAANAPVPVFDTVRVEPTGDSVIAGRSYPGAVVELLRNGVVHDRIVANASGEFAFIPPPFPPGTSEIILRVIGADGVAQQSEQSVTVVIADDLLTAPMVVMTAPDMPTVVLSRPEERKVEVAASQAADSTSDGAVEAVASDRRQLAAADATAYQSGRQTIRIASVEAEAGGGLYVTGEVTPNAVVRLYLNDTFVAPAEAGVDGTVTFSIGRGVRPGSYRVRLDEVTGETGSVLSRAEIIFVVPEFVAEAPVSAPDATDFSEPAEKVVAEAEAEVAPERMASVVIPEIATAVVTRGDSLWRISREVYGSGTRYTEIFEANQSQIRNPNLIYPGQLFVLPADPSRASAEMPEPEQGVN